ncbi:PIN domain-containing protein [Pseudomonas cedrina]|uniref:type II toxin-antitoxin system VapC family toxin n=1 Tax=Pseudomonas cedrina TaxID=651740 RepID=UPI001E3E26E4|nr:type II toxin-antitoxin system VapC family toxin [Pseudomonas cedrina]
MFRLPFTLCCTDFVLYELADFPHDELLAQGLLVESFDDAGVQKLLKMKREHGNSSMADVSCYLLAHTTGRPLLTGDGKLRRQAQKDGLQVRGALWLLDLMVEHHTITSSVAAQALENMLWHGARLPGTECSTRLSQWREPN